MKMTLGTSQAADMLFADKEGGWSYAGARALVEHLEELEESTGETIEFDAVAFRCDYDEYPSATAAVEQYNLDWPDHIGEDDEHAEEYALEWLREQTEVIKFDGGIIVRAF